jgi:hypothetical protein
MILWKRYLGGYLEVVSYSLNANHFHFLVRVPYFSEAQLLGRTEHELVSEQLKIFFRTYAMAFNKRHTRTGSLFEGPFKRVLIGDEHYLTYLIQYIHVNPEKNKLCTDFRSWAWSSYRYIVTPSESVVNRDFVLNWFGSLPEFVKFHSKENQDVDIRAFLSDDED